MVQRSCKQPRMFVVFIRGQSGSGSAKSEDMKMISPCSQAEEQTLLMPCLWPNLCRRALSRRLVFGPTCVDVHSLGSAGHGLILMAV